MDVSDQQAELYSSAYSSYMAIAYHNNGLRSDRCTHAPRPATFSRQEHYVACDASKLPDEIWQLILSWSGLRTSATAAACSPTFRSLHRFVSATPELLARALVIDHGLTGAVANLYGSPAGHHHERHAVHSDTHIAATLRAFLVLSMSPGTGAAAAATVAATSFAATAAAVTTVDPIITEAAAVVTEGPATDGSFTPLSFALNPHPLSAPATFSTTPGFHCSTGPGPRVSLKPLWSGGFLSAATSSSPLPLHLLGELICAAASAGHVHVVATVLALGAAGEDVNRAVLAASAAGRSGVVRLLLAAGADPNTAVLYGACALHEAARHGNTDVVEVLLDAGAHVDGASTVIPTAHLMHDNAPRPLPHPAPQHHRQQPLWPDAPRQLGASGSGANSAIAAATNLSLRLWPARSTDDVGRSRVEAAGAFTAPNVPLQLRVPLRLPPAAVTGAATPSLYSSLHFFDGNNDKNNSSSGGGASSSQRRLMCAATPKTPTAATAAASAEPWADSDQDGEDAAGSSCGGGEAAVLGTPARVVSQLQQAPPPPRWQRSPLPLPLRPPALPLMPSLTAPTSLPLPPALMAVLFSDRDRGSGPSPLLAACRGGHAATAALLLRRGASADTIGGSELLAAASPEVVDELLTAVPRLSVHLGQALVAATSARRTDVVAALLRRGADPTYRGGSALQEAAFKGQVDILKLLLEAGGERLRSCGALQAALNWAACFGRVAVMELLAPSNPNHP